ncbi:hypothetical protein HGRIS_008699 [Hohenbuehelia grisea]|uniref:CBM21 domain-containing protein n=1 Tax=Hohenbuehelia grisea TaxID=104357 RepID=A0ABR3J9U7_9AGAR
MPYSTPSHRRSPALFTDEKGPGAFAPLNALPRRPSQTQKKSGPVFHLRAEDDDDDEDDSSPEDADDGPVLKINANNNFRLGLSLKTDSFRPRNHHSPYKQPAAVPFPTSSPLSPPAEPLVASPVALSPRPQFSRTSSTPILLSNGKPLKSSLKSSSSSPSIALPLASVLPTRVAHLRARSAPSTPNPDILSPVGSLEFESALSTPGPVTPKNVHFPENDGLESVRVFSRSARPASLSSTTTMDDTETETEGESSSSHLRYNSAFPFPRVPPSNPPPSSSSSHPPSPSTYQIDFTASSPVPAPQPLTPATNILVESLTLNPAAPSTVTGLPHAPSLSGTIVVRNIAFEKAVAVRFTLDDWQTTSEVAARYVSSLSTLPSELARTARARARTVGDTALGLAGGLFQDHDKSAHGAWDRFAFTIRLEDYALKLTERTLWLVGRYTAPSVGEWWDNNAGSDYKVVFKTGEPQQPRAVQPRRTVVSAPAIPSLSQSPPTALHHSMTGPGFYLSQQLMQQRIPDYEQHALPQHHTQPSPTAVVAAQHLSKLNLKNYAAPAKVAVPPPLVKVSHPSPPAEQEKKAEDKERTQQATPPATPPRSGSPVSSAAPSSAAGIPFPSRGSPVPFLSRAPQPVSFPFPSMGTDSPQKTEAPLSPLAMQDSDMTPTGASPPFSAASAHHGEALRWPWGARSVQSAAALGLVHGSAGASVSSPVHSPKGSPRHSPVGSPRQSPQHSPNHSPASSSDEGARGFGTRRWQSGHSRLGAESSSGQQKQTLSPMMLPVATPFPTSSAQSPRLGSISERTSASAPTPTTVDTGLSGASATSSPASKSTQGQAPPSPTLTASGTPSASASSTNIQEQGLAVNPLAIAAGSSDDELYKAFIKQWCFASGPPPAVGGSAGGPRVVVG